METENVNYIVLNTNIIKELKIVNYKDVGEIYKESMKACDYDLEKLLVNEENLVEEHRQKRDVPEHVRLLFKEISKTYEAHWQDTSIVI